MTTIDPNLLALVVPIVGVLVVNVLNYMKTRSEAKDAIAERAQARKWQEEDASKILKKSQEAVDSSANAAAKSEKAVAAADHMAQKLMEQNDKINDLHQRQLKVEEEKSIVPEDKLDDLSDNIIRSVEETGKDTNTRVKKIESR